MKILSLHCDYIKFKPVKPALKGAKLEKSEEKEVDVKEPLVIMTAVEKSDETNKDILKLYLENVLDLLDKTKAKRLVLYPYAHLSPSLSNQDFAKNLMVEAESELKKKKIDVTRAPFGFYKEFELKCKGHPLAELSRSIGNQEEANQSGKVEVTKIMKSDERYDAKQLLHEISKIKLNREKLEDNDHRILGQKLDLFSFSEVAPGMVFWHNNGLIIYNELQEYWRSEHRKAGYQEISTPQILDRKLWQISGHWEKYRENIFLTNYEDKELAVKPMNCPGGMLVYRSSQKSYKDLPLRVGELGIVHRQELSGVLAGLFRVIKFTQDDAHIFCTEEQLEDEIKGVIELITKIYKKLGITLDHVELSTRPEKRIGDDKIWDKAEKILETVLKKTKLKYKINPGDGAFYGPKIDFHIIDSLNRPWQCGTIQLDFAMPERFELEYTASDGSKKRPAMLHRTILGSLERFIGVFLEETKGNLPTWLSPVQVRIISFTDRNIPACEKLFKEMRELGIRVDSDLESNTVNDKVRKAAELKIPYLITLGDKEEKAGTLAIKKRGEKDPKFGVKKETFFKELLEEIKERK
jgi:threonyl-tRNA synthetase